MIEQDALQFLSIVNKAGLIVTGAAKVEAAIRGGDILALIHASDGSADGTAETGADRARTVWRRG